MERTTNKSESKQIKWKKVGGGSFRLGNRIIKPGQKFTASEDEIPQAFRDVVVPLGSLPESKPAPVIHSVDSTYTLKSRKGTVLFDVVNSSGKVLNEKALTKEIAEKLIQDLVK